MGLRGAGDPARVHAVPGHRLGHSRRAVRPARCRPGQRGLSRAGATGGTSPDVGSCHTGRPGVRVRPLLRLARSTGRGRRAGTGHRRGRRRLVRHHPSWSQSTVRDGSTWRPASDDGSKVEKLIGATSGVVRLRAMRRLSPLEALLFDAALDSPVDLAEPECVRTADQHDLLALVLHPHPVEAVNGLCEQWESMSSAFGRPVRGWS